MSGHDGRRGFIYHTTVRKEYRGQKAIRLCEEMHGNENWELDTILQESKNCHLYEKMGYRQTGKTKVINERLTLTFYEKKEADRT